MKSVVKTLNIAFALLLATSVVAQEAPRDDSDELKMAAIQALISAPPERAMPLVEKVLAGDHSNEIKEKALFILSQIDEPEAQATLIRFATNSNGELQEEAIRMVGIGGNPDALAQLRGVYDGGDRDTRDAVLEALMIAGDKATVFDIASNAEGDDYEDAVEMLAVMDAREELRQLRASKGASEALIDACAISDDLACLQEIAADASGSEEMLQAIEAMGIIGGDEVNETLVGIYRNATSNDVREAALDGMLIADYDEGVLQLFRESNDSAEKKELLQRLVIMDSDAVWEIVDSTLEGGF